MNRLPTRPHTEYNSERLYHFRPAKLKHMKEAIKATKAYIANLAVPCSVSRPKSKRTLADFVPSLRPVRMAPLITWDDAKLEFRIPCSIKLRDIPVSTLLTLYKVALTHAYYRMMEMHSYADPDVFHIVAHDSAIKLAKLAAEHLKLKTMGAPAKATLPEIDLATSLYSRRALAEPAGVDTKWWSTMAIRTMKPLCTDRWLLITPL